VGLWLAGVRVWGRVSVAIALVVHIFHLLAHLLHTLTGHFGHLEKGTHKPGIEAISHYQYNTKKKNAQYHDNVKVINNIFSPALMKT
jgi:hypothetical protein